jgi:hypothetical protein
MSFFYQEPANPPPESSYTPPRQAFEYLEGPPIVPKYNAANLATRRNINARAAAAYKAKRNSNMALFEASRQDFGFNAAAAAAARRGMHFANISNPTGKLRAQPRHFHQLARGSEGGRRSRKASRKASHKTSRRKARKPSRKASRKASRRASRR